MPGWMRPANLTPGMCLEEQNMPSKSQIAFALQPRQSWERDFILPHSRLGIDLVQKPAAIILVKDASETPGMVLERLYVHDLHKENIAWLGIFNLERPREVVDLGEVNVLDIVGAVVIPDLTTSPVEAFNLHSLAILDSSAKGDCIQAVRQ